MGEPATCCTGDVGPGLRGGDMSYLSAAFNPASAAGADGRPGHDPLVVIRES